MDYTGLMPKKKTQSILPIILLLIIALGIPLILVAINLGFNPFVSAGPTEEPKDIVVSNLSGNTATVSFFTPAAATDSIIKYGASADNITLIATDRRDLTTGTSGLYVSHLIDIGNLVPKTQYFYIIVVGGKEYLNAGQPFSFTTLEGSELITTPSPVYGKIEPQTAETLIYSHAVREGAVSTPASAIIAANGTFTFDLSTLKDPATGAVFNTTGGQIVTFAQSPIGTKGAVGYPADEQPGTIALQTGSSLVYSTALLTVPTSVTPTVTVSATPLLTATPQPTSVVSQTPVPTTTDTTASAESLLLITESYSSGQELTDATVPYEIFISNISTTGFSLNWRTNEPTTAAVAVDGQNQIFLDDRDSSSLAAKKRYTHKTTINTSGLSSGSVTSFTPLSNNNRFSKTFTFKIPAVTSSPPSPENISGSTNKQFAALNDKDELIYGRKTTPTGKSTWKSTIPGTGNFVLALGDAYNQQLTSYFQASSPQVELKAISEFNSLSSTSTQLTATPVLQLKTGLALTSITQSSALTAVPQIRGTAAPNSSVTVTINNTVNTTTAGSAGSWSLLNPQGLAIGTNRISLASGGKVMGISFTLNLDSLPATDLQYNMPLFAAIVLIFAGYYLQRKVRHYRKIKH